MTNPETHRLVSKLGILVTVGVCSGCGYEPVYGGDRPTTRLSVTAAPYGTPDVAAVAAATRGVRRSLSSAGVLKPGTGYPRAVVEVVRVDEQAGGIVAVQSGAGENLPRARSLAVGVVGRAWVEAGAHAAKTRDTGDVRRIQRYAPVEDARLERLHHDEAISAAAHALGRALGRRILGEPEATFEPM